jgi:exosome complex RNA-binding protein Csl4
MQDFLGQELKEGDIIFYHMTTGRGRKQACIGRVEKVREKTAAIKIIKHEQEARNGENTTLHAGFNAIIVNDDTVKNVLRFKLTGS